MCYQQVNFTLSTEDSGQFVFDPYVPGAGLHGD